MRFNVSLINRMAREAENLLLLGDLNFGFDLRNKASICPGSALKVSQ